MSFESVELHLVRTVGGLRQIVQLILEPNLGFTLILALKIFVFGCSQRYRARATPTTGLFPSKTEWDSLRIEGRSVELWVDMIVNKMALRSVL